MKLNELLETSVKEDASDLHLSPNQPPLYRLHGELINVTQSPALSADEIKELLFGVMTQEQRDLFKQNLEFDFALALPSVANFRVNVFFQAYGIAAVFRTIPEKIPTMEQLGLPSETLRPLLDLSNGLILVTGPTGSGKSTTLAALVDYINSQQSSHIITIEDPIEFIYTSKKSLINQRQVHRDTHDFTAALRSALREDPDVILIGEMRDLETIRLALTAAETGHLVMGTLHTSSAPRTINRIVDVFPASEKNMIRNMLSDSLQAVICQTLVPKLEGGRVAAFEIMLGTTAIRNLIREDKVSQMYNAMQTGSQFGMCTLDQYLRNLVMANIISESIAQETAINKDSFSTS